MDLKQIKELMSAMGRSGITKVAIKDGKYELTLERADGKKSVGDYPHTVITAQPLMTHGIPMDVRPHVGFHPSDSSLPHQSYNRMGDHSAVESAEAAGKKNSKFITAPIVGTYYSSPSPESPVFVKVGDKVSEDTVVCIIEAMKVMNEVKAGVAGTVAEFLVENGHPVEFGSKLFRIEE